MQRLDRNQSLFIPFVNGKPVLDSQNKVRIYGTKDNFDKHFPKHYMRDCESFELVEYIPKRRVKDESNNR